MIIKKISNSGVNRRGKETADYIRDSKDHDFGEKVSCHGTINTLSENWDEAVKELQFIEKAYDGDGNSLMHVVIAWDKDEFPTKEQEKEAWQIALKNLGMEKHEMIFAGHSNTQNYHSHGLISRVDPNSENNRLKLSGGSVEKKSGKKMRNNEVKCLHVAVAEICKKQGWNAEHNMYDSNLQLKSQLNSDKVKLGQKIESEEARTGIISKERIMAEKAIDTLRESKSWKEAQEKLLQDKISVKFTEKNGKLGAVLINDSTKVKFSALHLTAHERILTPNIIQL